MYLHLFASAITDVPGQNPALHTDNIIQFPAISYVVINRNSDRFHTSEISESCPPADKPEGLEILADQKYGDWVYQLIFRN